jgi:hypothetical protein
MTTPMRPLRWLASLMTLFVATSATAQSPAVNSPAAVTTPGSAATSSAAQCPVLGGTRPGGRQAGHRRRHDHLAGLVARGLRPLWSTVHPDGLAQRGHLPHQRWPRWRRQRRHSASPH